MHPALSRSMRIFSLHRFSHSRGQLSQWLSQLSSVRARILIWYFLLTIGVTLASVWITFKIFCDQETVLASQRLLRDASAFQVFVERFPPDRPESLVPLLEEFISQRIIDPNERFFLYINGQRQDVTGQPLLETLTPQRLNHWAQTPTPRDEGVREEYLIRIVQPITGAKPTSALLVGVYDNTLRYQMAERTLLLVLQITLISLLAFSAVAWLTAGRVLAPLRQLKETAHTITETDLSRRIETQGRDELAELSITFNEMLDRLQAAFVSQQDFIRDVSHELRTPITVIRGHLELLGDDPQEQAETIALVQDELRRMNRFVSDLLLLMRAERPDFLRLGTMDLSSFTEEIFAKARGLASRRWQLEINADGEVILDRQRITQVLLNLAQNATQYTNEHNRITLGANLTTSEVSFWIRDDGEGIAPEDQQRIFERFARGRNSERRSDGSGLGLAIVQALVKAHGGYLELYSRIGEGAAFTIVLPRRSSGVVRQSVQRLPLSPYRFFEQGTALVRRM